MSIIKMRIIAIAIIIKRIIFVCLVMVLSVNCTSCFKEWHEFAESTVTDSDILISPNYTEDYSYLPIIEYKGKEYRVDLLCRDTDRDESKKEGSDSLDLVFNFTSLEKYFRENRDSTLIVYGTVIDNAVQTEMHSADDPSNNNEILCPFKIDEMQFRSHQDPLPYGIYWLKIECLAPAFDAMGAGTPEVGVEYDGVRSYLFAIIMD